MDKEEIKNQLINEVNSLMNTDGNSFTNTHGLLDKLEMWKTKLGNVEDFGEQIVAKLNEIIKNNNIKFKDEAEKNELISFLQPTIQELIVKNIKK